MGIVLIIIIVLLVMYMFGVGDNSPQAVKKRKAKRDKWLLINKWVIILCISIYVILLIIYFLTL